LFIGSLVVLNLFVAVAFSTFVRSLPLAVLASVAGTVLIAGLLFALTGADSEHPEDSVLLAFSCTVIFGTPVLTVTSVPFVMLGRLLRVRFAPSESGHRANQAAEATQPRLDVLHEQ